MTLILALGNPDQVIQISDRRLSSNGRLLDNESNKAGVLTCLNARMAFGFTGLARWGSFMTRDWLLNALSESGQPDFSIGGILRRLKIKADKTFSENPALRVATKTDKRLSIMFSGYLYFENSPRQGFAILTNFQNFKTGQDDIQAWDEFVLTHWTERRPTDEACTLVQRVGNWHAMEEKDVFPLRTLLLKRKPSTAIIGKAIDLIREMADRPAAQGTIGKQLSTIRVPANLQEPVESGYYSTFNKTVYYMADGVILLPDQQIAIKDAQFKAVDPEAPPLVVNKVGRNHPCPCGSGKKYKFCHGR